eukprot:jgi/Botrbrau1/19414/Bobra.0338s0041.1
MWLSSARQRSARATSPHLMISSAAHHPSRSGRDAAFSMPVAFHEPPSPCKPPSLCMGGRSRSLHRHCRLVPFHRSQLPHLCPGGKEEGAATRAAKDKQSRCAFLLAHHGRGWSVQQILSAHMAVAFGFGLWAFAKHWAVGLRKAFPRGLNQALFT